ncbi:peptidase dimerization domain-containing protein, partial [Desulfovibrio sp.]|uniref:peptidase dimerization domain-containing protein n=1 Tax=Desulfovibrio sp. TaxID=885 RepID=UPI00307B4CBA
ALPISEGGTAPNIVPDNATVWYYVRAPKRETVDEVYDRLVKVAEGAALMLPEARMESDGLMAQVTDLLQDTGRLRTMAAAASGCARVRAAELVAAELETVCAR